VCALVLVGQNPFLFSPAQFLPGRDVDEEREAVRQRRVERFGHDVPRLLQIALQLQAHDRVREASRGKAKVRIEPVLPVDILGAYLLLPVL
jgi:hypothetical protein